VGIRASVLSQVSAGCRRREIGGGTTHKPFSDLSLGKSARRPVDSRTGRSHSQKDALYLLANSKIGAVSGRLKRGGKRTALPPIGKEKAYVTT